MILLPLAFNLFSLLQQKRSPPGKVPVLAFFCLVPSPHLFIARGDDMQWQKFDKPPLQTIDLNSDGSQGDHIHIYVSCLNSFVLESSRAVYLACRKYAIKLVLLSGLIPCAALLNGLHRHCIDVAPILNFTQKRSNICWSDEGLACPEYNFRPIDLIPVDVSVLTFRNLCFNDQYPFVYSLSMSTCID